MNKRYVLNTFSLAAGVFLLVTSRVFTGGDLKWTVFGISGLVAIAGAIGLALAQERRHLAGFGALTAVATWAAIVGLVFTGTTLGWLALADAILVSLVAFAALAIHEVTTERVVHTLEVSHAGTYQPVG